jgi:acetyl-CoA acetyltransferase
VALAADRIRLGEADVMIAAGHRKYEHGAHGGKQAVIQSRHLRPR